MTDESALRARFRARVRVRCPTVVVVGIPNAAKRGQWAVNQAKREGLVSGVPDDICIWPGAGVCWIEWKAGRAGPSPNQRDVIALLGRYGFPVRVCRDPDEGLAFLAECGAPFLESRRAGA